MCRKEVENMQIDPHQINALTSMSRPELCLEWERRFGESPPATQSADWLRWLLAWRLQERVEGPLPARTRRLLLALAETFERDPEHRPTAEFELKPGTVLMREWRGVRHRVRVLREGYEYSERRFASLSEVARAITGTRWSGPRFFGLASCKIQEAKS
ncbi:MAG: DUF2924 domain-containing protein [Bdellovibrionia bacterium]